MPPSFDKLSGCLLGQCVGDAFGYPVEGADSDECLDYLHRQMKPLWHNTVADLSHPFGQYTDDSQLARELLISLLECKGYDPDDYARRICYQFDNHLVIGPGLACHDAVRRIKAGVPLDLAGCPPPQAGNGTAMRAAPIGMLYHDRPKEMIRVARQQGWITHRDPRCDAGSIAIAGAVALALHGSASPDSFCNQLTEWMSEADPAFASYVRELPTIVSVRPEDALIWINRAGKEEGYVDHWPGISPFVVSSVLWSLYAFLHSPDDYYASIWTSIAVGGDVDSTAAMTGAISGAYVGASALPQHLLDQLHDHNHWRATDLLSLCHRAEQFQNRSAGH